MMARRSLLGAAFGLCIVAGVFTYYAPHAADQSNAAPVGSTAQPQMQRGDWVKTAPDGRSPACDSVSNLAKRYGGVDDAFEAIKHCVMLESGTDVQIDYVGDNYVTIHTRDNPLDRFMLSIDVETQSQYAKDLDDRAKANAAADKLDAEADKLDRESHANGR